MARQAGRYGRRTPKRAPSLKLARYLTGTIPAHPAGADYLARLSGWQMLGNDRYGDCVSPDTRVLTADLRWVPAGDLVLGQRLLAFDEESRPAAAAGAKRPGRCYLSAVVERVDRVMRPCYELEFDDGTVVRCSAGHRWLIGSLANGARWAETKNLKAGGHNASSVCKPLSVWETDRSWEAGYLSGTFDSEGNMDQTPGTRLGKEVCANRVVFSQVDNTVLAEAERCLKELGFDYRHDVQLRGGNSCQDGSVRQDIHRLTLGRRTEFLRFLGMVRPQRLLDKFQADRLGRMDRTHVARLIRKTYLGEQEVVMLDTSARTYFAEGLASHNCVAVTWANTRRLVTAALAAENYPGMDQVTAVYETQNPGFPSEDNGMDIQTLLEYLVSTGGPDGVRAVGFASVDYTRPEEVKAAIAIFGSVWTGINVLSANMDEFNAGQPWDYVAASGVDGGHSVITGGYGAGGSGQLGGDEKFITWAQETSFTDAFWANQVEEAWVVIWPEHLGSAEFLAGVDMAAFAADYTEITGKPFPAPVPAPTPTPTPVPAPVPTPGPDTADAALYRQTKSWAAGHHIGENRQVADDLKAWFAAKGLGG